MNKRLLTWEACLIIMSGMTGSFISSLFQPYWVQNEGNLLVSFFIVFSLFVFVGILLLVAHRILEKLHWFDSSK